MKIIITKDYDELSQLAAQAVCDVVTSNPSPVLGLATGSTPIGAYSLLANFFRQKKLSFQKVKTVNLDEYVGLGEESDQSYVNFMNRHLFDLVDLPRQSVNIPNGKAQNLQDECRRYGEIVAQNACDLQILGLGSNGHIGFNEPNTPFDSVTHVVQLAENTVKDNSRFFSDISLVPTQAITMGIAEIMQAKQILLLVSGANKADALYRAVCGPVSESCPASILQTHPNCTVIADVAAASKIAQKA